MLRSCIGCRLSCVLVATAAGGDELEDCLRLVEVQLLELSDRPYAPTARPTQTLLLVTALVDVMEAAHRHGHTAGTHACDGNSHVATLQLCIKEARRHIARVLTSPSPCLISGLMLGTRSLGGGSVCMCCMAVCTRLMVISAVLSRWAGEPPHGN